MSAIALLRRILRCERAISAVEYGFLCCLIVLVMVTALRGLANGITMTWNNVSTQVETAVGGAAS